jgi:hypothetical protein
MLSFRRPPHLPKIQEKIQLAKSALEPIKNYLATNAEYNQDLQFSDNGIQAAMLRSKLDFYNMIITSKHSELSEEVEAKISVYETQLEHIYMHETKHSFKTLRALEDMRKLTKDPSKAYCIGRAIYICNKKITIDKSVAALLFEDVACILGVGERVRYESLLEVCKKDEVQQYANLSLHRTKDSFSIKYSFRETQPSIEIMELLLSIDGTHLSASDDDQERLADMYAKHVKKMSEHVVLSL